MARPRKDSNLLEMSGTLRDHPGRYADVPPAPKTKGPLGDPPEEFKASSDRLRLEALWNKIREEAPIGLLTVSDREYVADVCRVGVESKRTGTRNQLRALEIYGRMLKGLGMTPEGRAIRGIGGKAATKTANPLDSFRRQRRRAI